MHRRFRLAGALLLGVGFTAAPIVAQDAARPLDALSWLGGEWTRTTSRGTAVERWTRVSDGTMEGVGEVTVGGSTRVTEHLRLLHFGRDVFYLAKPAENPLPTAFRLTELTDSTAVFENRSHDFPQRIRYRRIGPDTLSARIEGPRGAAQAWGGVDFVFTRRTPGGG